MDEPSKWIEIPTDEKEVLKLTKSLAKEVRQAADVQSKLPLLKSSQELITKIDEILVDVEEQAHRIEETMVTSSTVFGNLKSLCHSIQEVHEFFTILNETKIMFFAKSKLNKRLLLLQQNLRQKCTQLLTSVSLELFKIQELAATKIPEVKQEVKVNKDVLTECLEGHKFYYGIFTQINYERAFKHYIYAAERGNLDAMVAIGDMYCNGQGIAQDSQSASAWYQRAHEMGSGAAKYRLAMIILNELESGNLDLVNPSINKNHGNSNTHSSSSKGKKAIILEEIREEKFRAAMDLIIEASETGHVDSQTMLGQLAEMNSDFEDAAKWYNIAISNGSSESQNLLGILHFHGKGVRRLREKAYELFLYSHANGNIHGTNNVAMCLEHGIGVEKDVTKALEYYKIGAMKGSVNAKYSYGYLLVKCGLEDRVGGAKDGKQALIALGKSFDEADILQKDKMLFEGVSWLRSAMEGGIADAAYQLGLLYEQGLGLPYDLSSAYTQFLWAAKNGHAKGALCAANMIYCSCIEEKTAFGDYVINLVKEKYDDKRIVDSNSQNLQFAASLYFQAAEGGLVEAMNAYASMLEDGTANIHNFRNIPEAAKWYFAAAEGGYLQAATNLGMMLSQHVDIEEFETVNGETISVSEILTWLEKIAASPQIPSGDNFSEVIERLMLRTRNKSTVSSNLTLMNAAVYSDTKTYNAVQPLNKKTTLPSDVQRQSFSNPINVLSKKELQSSDPLSDQRNNNIIESLPQLHRMETKWNEDEKKQRARDSAQYMKWIDEKQSKDNGKNVQWQDTYYNSTSSKTHANDLAKMQSSTSDIDDAMYSTLDSNNVTRTNYPYKQSTENSINAIRTRKNQYTID